MITKVFYDTLDSSKLEHARLAATGSDSDRWIIRAASQTAGVGRGKNTWHSPSGGLWLSFDFFHSRAVPSFPLYVGFCLHKLLTRSFGLSQLSVKWPNDIYLEDKKLAGILCQQWQNPPRYLISLGLNTNLEPDDVLLELNAANLSSYIKMPVSNDCLADLLVRSVSHHSGLLASPQTYINYCAARLHGLGREAEVENGNETLLGRIAGLTDAGFLLLDGMDGVRMTVTHGSLKIL